MADNSSGESWGAGILVLIGIGVIVAILGAIAEGVRIAWEAFTASSLSSDSLLSVALWIFVSVSGATALVQILNVRARLSVRGRQAAPLILLFGVLSIILFASVAPNLPVAGSSLQFTITITCSFVAGSAIWGLRSIRRIEHYRALVVLFLLTILISLGLYARFAAHKAIVPFLFAFMFGMAFRLAFLIHDGDLLSRLAVESERHQRRT